MKVYEFNVCSTMPSMTCRNTIILGAKRMENENTKQLMHCHCGTHKRAPRWTFSDLCKPEVRPGAREESASPAWLAAPAKFEDKSLKL